MAGWGEHVPQSGEVASAAENGWGNVATQNAAAVDGWGPSGGSGSESYTPEIQNLRKKERRGARTNPDTDGFQTMNKRVGSATWECDACHFMNFPARVTCLKCTAQPPEHVSPVFCTKMACFKCNVPRPGGAGGGGFPSGKFGDARLGGGGGHQIETRPGDWECPDCGKVVFKNKSECFSCGAPKPEDLDDGPPGFGPFGGSQKFEARPGDWECPDCGKVVFKNKSECFSCGAPKPEGLDDGFGGGTFRGSQNSEARPGDWVCPDCGKLVFKSKSECFSCGAPKPEGLDDGFGGGTFGGSQKFEARPGDWECPDCGKLVFKNKSECFSCGAPKPVGLDDGFGGGGSGYGGGSRPGDWNCPECQSSNFANRLQCRSCNAVKPEGLGGDEEGGYTQSGSYSGGGGGHERNSTGKGIVLFNLPWRADAEALTRDFADCGQVVKAEIQHDQDGRSRGIGTILFSTEQAAQAAIDTYNNTEYGGRELRIRVDSSA